MAAIIGNRNISLGVMGGTLITAACYSGGNVFGCSPYDAATTAYLKATYPGHWQAIRQFGFDNPSAVPFINANPEAFHAFMDYVQDGLVFQLDHTIMCSAAQWTDRIGNVAFVGQNVQLQDGVPYFNGNAYYLSTLKTIYPIASSTIECVFKATNWNGHLYDCTAGGIGMRLQSSKYLPVSTAGGTVSLYTAKKGVNTLITVSAASTNVYENQVKLTASGSDYWGTQGDGTYIGGMRFKHTGTIQTIRIYNRLLTEQEILQNQAADLARWNTN